MFNQSHVQRLQAAAAARLSNFHSPKRQLLGNKAIPAPAWKPNIVNSVNNVDGTGARKGKEVGSKILLTKLPVDVTPLEVEVSY
jgi:THO complex subunit 4